jgi:hypothetical protein
MYELFYKYLLLNHHVALPGVGNFTVVDVSAKLDFITQSIAAPSQVIQFQQSHSVNDKGFYFYAAKTLQINEAEANQQVMHFAQTIKDAAFNDGVELPGIGSLKKATDDTLFFIPETNQHSVLSNIRLSNTVAADANLVDLYDAGENRIIVQKVKPLKQEHEMAAEKEDYWWVYAIVLAVFGLGALLFYYI